jgi:hypothetical protein
MVSAKITERLFIGVELEVNWAEIWFSENSELSEAVSMSEHIVSDSDPEIVNIEFTELDKIVVIFESGSEVLSGFEFCSGNDVSKLSEFELSELKFELSESVMKSSDLVRLYLLFDFFKMVFSGFLFEIGG